MNIEAVKEEYTEKMEKALRRGDFALFDNLRRQYDRLMQAREEVPAKKITDTMTKEDREKCNKLLRKIPVLADIAEGAGIDLLALLKKYDDVLELKERRETIKRLLEYDTGIGSAMQRLPFEADLRGRQLKR